MKTLKSLLASLAFVIGIGASFAFAPADTLTQYNSAKPIGGQCNSSLTGTAPAGCAVGNPGDPCVVSISSTDHNIYSSSGCSSIFNQEF